MELNTLAIVFFGIGVAYLVAIYFSRRVILGKVQRFLRQDNPQGALDYLDKPGVRFAMPAYNREHMRLNTFLLMNKTDKVSQCFDTLLTMRTSKSQRRDVVMRAFQYYMQAERYKDAKALLGEIKSTLDPALAAECERTYDIFARKSTSHIAEMEAEVETAPYARKASIAYLLAASYANADDEKNSEKWRAYADGLFSNPPEKK